MLTVITFVLVLLMPDGSVMTQARQVASEAECGARKEAALAAAQLSSDVVNAGVACFKTEFDPLFKPHA